MTPRDWAQDLIADLHRVGIADANDATQHFVATYADGDSMAAWETYWATATQVYDVEGEGLAVFPDGSAYVGWSQGIDRFYPDLDLVREHYPEELAGLGI